MNAAGDSHVIKVLFLVPFFTVPILLVLRYTFLKIQKVTSPHLIKLEAQALEIALNTGKHLLEKTSAQRDQLYKYCMRIWRAIGGFASAIWVLACIAAAIFFACYIFESAVGFLQIGHDRYERNSEN